MERPPLPGYVLVYARYVVRKGKRIYPKNARFFRFWAKPKVKK